MQTDFLVSLGSLTLGGAVAVILFAVTARTSRVRYAARWRCWIWVLLCLRLIVPVSFLQPDKAADSAPIQVQIPPSSVEIEINIPDTPIREEDEVLPTVSPTLTPSDTPAAAPVPGVPLEPQYGTPVSDTPEFVLSLAEILVLIWIVGMAVMLIWVVISHLRFVRYVRRWSRPMGEADAIRTHNQCGDLLRLKTRPGLYLCPGLKAPMLAGLLQPRLLLPEDVGRGDTLRFVLIHELTHYKRRDIWLKSLALLANIVHWFNPFMWYMVRLVERDTELACDEAALRMLPPADHGAYGRTILDAVERLKLK